MVAVSDFVNWLSANNISGILYATWTVISDFATRVYNLFTGLMGAIVSFANNDFVSMGIYMSQITTAVAEGWTQTQEKIKASYVQGAVDYKIFMEGQVNQTLNANATITENNEQAMEDLKLKYQGVYQKWEEVVQKMIDKYWEASVEMAEENQAILELQYEMNIISRDEYLWVLNEQLLTAKTIYGEMSLQYLELMKKKKKMDDDASKAKLKTEELTAKSTLDAWSGMGRDLDTMNRYIFGKSKGLAYVSAMINTYEAASKAAAQTGIFAPFAIAAALAQGFAMVSMISAQKYARGGIVTGPTLGLVGEAGPEIIAPKKTFIDVQNELIRSGQVGGSNSRTVEGKLDKLISAIEGQKLSVAFDDDQLAIRVERGNAILQSRNY